MTLMGKKRDFDALRRKMIAVTSTAGYDNFNLNLTSRLHWNEYEVFVKDVLTYCPDGGVVFDPGCGFGMVTEMLEAQGQKCIALDLPFPINPHIKHIKFSKVWSHLAGRYLAGDVECLPFVDGIFDVVATHAVLEHVPHPERFLSECSRIMKPEGTLLIYELPKVYSVEYFLRNTPVQTHTYFLREHEIRSLLDAHGFVPVRIEEYRVFPELLMTWVRGRIAVSMVEALDRAASKLFGNYWKIVARKR